MDRIIALTLAVCVASAAGRGALRSNSQMRPDVVAITMSHVEGQWKAQAHVAAQCKSQDNSALPICAEAPKAFHNSCTKVVSAIMVSSQGNLADAKAYMTSVCSQKTISGWQKSCCSFVGQSIVAHMSDDTWDNRNSHVEKSDKTCGSLWEHFVEEQMSEEEKNEAKHKIDVARKEAHAKISQQTVEQGESSMVRAFKAIGGARSHKVKASKKLPRAQVRESVGLEKKSTKSEEPTKPVEHVEGSIERAFKAIGGARSHKVKASKKLPRAHVEESVGLAKDKIEVVSKGAQAKKSRKPVEHAEDRIERAFEALGGARSHKVKASKKAPSAHLGESVGLAKKTTKKVEHTKPAEQVKPVEHVEGSIKRAFKIIGGARSRRVRASKKVPHAHVGESVGLAKKSTKKVENAKVEHNKPVEHIEGSIKRAFKIMGGAKSGMVKASNEVPRAHVGQSVGLAKKSTDKVEHAEPVDRIKPVEHVEGSIQRAFKTIGAPQ